MRKWVSNKVGPELIEQRQERGNYRAIDITDPTAIDLRVANINGMALVSGEDNNPVSIKSSNPAACHEIHRIKDVLIGLLDAARNGKAAGQGQPIIIASFYGYQGIDPELSLNFYIYDIEHRPALADHWILFAGNFRETEPRHIDYIQDDFIEVDIVGPLVANNGKYRIDYETGYIIYYAVYPADIDISLQML